MSRDQACQDVPPQLLLLLEDKPGGPARVRVVDSQRRHIGSRGDAALRQHEPVADWARLIGLAAFVASLMTMLVLALFQVTTVSRTVDSGPPSKVDCGSLFEALNSPAMIDALPRTERNPAATPCRGAGVRRTAQMVMVPLAVSGVALITWFVARRRRVLVHA